MNLLLDTEQQQLVAACRALYRREASPASVRAAEPLGYDADLWNSLAKTGVVAMAVPEDQGGWGASMLDLVLVAEQHGRAVAPAPLVDAQAAARLLARSGAAGASALAAALEGAELVVLAPRPARGGRLPLVPAGAVADRVVARVDDAIVMVNGHGDHVENLGGMPAADLVAGADATVLLAGEAADAAWESAIDDWFLLMSGCLVGVAARALEIGVDYAKGRQAFGSAIGSFQAVAHPLADSATAIDGARLLSYRAAWSVAEEPAHASELGALAYAMAYEAARDTTRRSLHIHGGYGFIMEQDIQLYFRRARAWAQVLGTSAEAFERAADRRYGPRATA